MRYLLRPTALLVMLLALCATPAARVTERRASYFDAFVDFDHGSGEWTIGNGAVTYTLAVGRDRSLDVVGLAITGTLDPVTARSSFDSVISMAGSRQGLGEPGGNFVVESVQPSTGTHFVALSVRFASPLTGVVATRRYVAYPSAGAIEMWTEIETADGEAHTLSNLNAYDIVIPQGSIDLVTGLDTPAADGGAFTRQRRSLERGQRLDVGSATLSSEAFLPFVSIGNGHRRVFSGLLWSGAWSLSLSRENDLMRVTFGLPPMSARTAPGHRIEGPHAFVGVTWDQPGTDVAAVTRFVHAGRAGRAFPAATTFNTWFVHGINIDEDTARRDIDHASELGIELFQLDAGWYPRRRPESVFDFTTGLGAWEADAERFPSGLAALGDYARGRGMKFGLWVEPERVSLETVGRPGLAEESFLAREHDHYQPGVANEDARDAQICLAEPAARAWVTARLMALIEAERPDNIKWDFNRWVHCTRSDHHHPADGGNYEHTRALYEILSAIRQRFPELTIENCSGGGHRLDFAMARLTDTAWMDDRTAPSSHVRRNLQGLLGVFPASYLFAYVMSGGEESVVGANDIPWLVRSRMPGVVGLATELTQLGERERNQLHQEMELAKRLRPLQEGATTYVLTPQHSGAEQWDVVQQVLRDSGVSVVFAFASGSSESVVVSLRGIQPDVTYELRSADRGPIGRRSGADLIGHGLTIVEASETRAQVLVLQPVTGPSAR